ncbi:hypothetical protein [Aequorivita capsosiphonis]|uniref:hypothetical protein n=1 Tax=Aequorivita capsosiphonis TaxID=487317 RepID=UPI00055428CA|nr:hypothetical protein [Aequorivita capsosiphonis]
MKTIIKIILMTSIFQACTSQSDFDLTQLTLNGEKVNALVTKEMKNQVFPLGNTENEYLNVRDDKFLNFNGTNLVGRQNPNSENGVNGVSFYYNKNDSVIYKYEIYIFSDKQARDLVSALNDKLGKPQFTHFKKPEDKDNNKFDALLWEDITNNKLYLLNYGLDGTVKAKLEVKNNSSDIEELNIIGAFGYWEDYLYVRKRKNNPHFSYQDFIKEDLESDPNSYYNAITK